MTEEEMAEMAADVCPRCESNLMASELAFNALSRKDNETYVCSPCGEDEAVRDYVGIPAQSWPICNGLTFENLIHKLADESLLGDLITSGHVDVKITPRRLGRG